MIVIYLFVFFTCLMLEDDMATACAIATIVAFIWHAVMDVVKNW